MRRVLAFSFFVCIVWGNPFMREVIVLSILIGVIWALSWGIAILAKAHRGNDHVRRFHWQTFVIVFAIAINTCEWFGLIDTAMAMVKEYLF